jgi:hypothetical protein
MYDDEFGDTAFRIRRPNRVNRSPRISMTPVGLPAGDARSATWAATAQSRNRWAGIDGSGRWHRRPAVA